MDEQSSRRDLLSDLRLSIIHLILSFLPIRDAIRTSILSKKWRYKWASLPHLAFDDECVLPPLKNVSHEKRLSHFINQTLFLHQGPIHTFEFRLSHISMGERHCIDQWLLFLSRNHIRTLLLEIDETYDDEVEALCFEIPSSLYSCQNLTHLKLYVSAMPPPPPSFKGFLFLRSLYIYMDQASHGTIESIVALSPLLEKFTLYFYVDSKMTICAPNLKHFHLESGPDHLSLCTPLLEEFVGDFTGIESFSIEVESLVFHHLRTIELSDVYFSNKEVSAGVIRLINGSPNLQKLTMTSWEIYESESSELVSASLWDSYVTYDNLKVIKLEDLRCKINGFKLVKFLLARSPVLEKMIFKPRPSLSDLELLKITNQLLRYSRASANAEIVMLDDRVSSS